ncbi:hypothetical protein D3C74_406080 [compost metagenome]
MQNNVELIAMNFDVDLPAVQLNDAFHNGQPQAGAFSLAGFICSFETFEQLFRSKINLIRSRILNFELYLIIRFVQINIDSGSWKRIFLRVAN